MTRQRIVQAAAELMLERGIAGTRLEDVQLAAGVSTGQVYHYFADKQALVLAVVDFQSDEVLDAQEPLLARLDTMTGLRAWRDAMVEHQRRLQCVGGCPIGSLGSELAETDPAGRHRVAASFERWHGGIHHGLRRMQERGELAADVDVDDLALEALTALQGGLLLTQIQRTTRPLAVALDGIIARISALRTQAGQLRRTGAAVR